MNVEMWFNVFDFVPIIYARSGRYLELLVSPSPGTTLSEIWTLPTLLILELGSISCNIV